MNKPVYDIEKRTFQFSVDLLKYLREVPMTLESTILTKQVLRSGTSIGANIHEAKVDIQRKIFHIFIQ